MRRLLGIAITVAVAAFTTVVASAAGLPTAVYQASVSPSSAVVGQPGGFTVTLTDCGIVDNQTVCSNQTPLLAFDNMDKATLTLTDAPGTVLAVSPSTWTATADGNTVTLQANGSANDLTFGQSLSVTLPVPSLPSQIGSDSIQTAATDPSGFSFSRAGSDPTLQVTAGPVASLTYTQQPGNIVAGQPFNPAVALAAANQYGVAEPNTPVTLALQNASGATLSGTVTQSTDGGGKVAFPGLSVAKAGSGYSLLATSGPASQGSSTFSVSPGPVANLTYTQQPSETPVGATIAPPVAVRATDAFGNPVPGTPVSVALHANSAGGQLSGTLTRTADSTGTASFGNLSINKAGFGYTLLASAAGVSSQSAPFTVSTTEFNCLSYPCTGTTTDAAGTTSVTATLSGLSEPSLLFVTMYNPSLYAPPADACGSTGVQGSGARIDVVGGGGTPTKTLTWRLDKSIVNQNPSNGASQYSICMGAVNTANPSQSWTTKGGGPAILEADGKFWGLLPLCSAVTTVQPCITSQSKNGQGDVLITMSVPSPWDEQFVGGLLKTGV